MSVNEVLRLLSKILGRLPKSEFSSIDRPLDAIMDILRTYNPTVFSDHVVWSGYVPSDSVAQIDVGGAAVLRIRARYSPVMVNFDRPLESEYIIVDPDTYQIIPRLTSKIYAKTLQGYPPAFVEVFGLKVS